MKPLDARITRQAHGGASFSLGNRALRALWILVWTLLARWTPPPLHGWRRFLLRLFGAKVGRHVRVYGRVRVWYPPNLTLDDYACLGPDVNCYNQGSIHIGVGAIISQGAHLCAGTHDISDPNFQIVARPITISARVWVAAEAFVGPGVSIGEGAVLGARAVALRDVSPWQVCIGNPAVAVKQRVLREE